MNSRVFFIISLLTWLTQSLSGQNTPWDIIYCLNGGENKSAGISKQPIPNPAEKAGWHLIFRDEFQTDSLDPEKWNRSTPFDDGNGTCLRGFAVNPANVLVENGNARILNSIDSQLPQCPYSFGEIKSTGTWAPKASNSLPVRIPISAWVAVSSTVVTTAAALAPFSAAKTILRDTLP